MPWRTGRLRLSLALRRIGSFQEIGAEIGLGPTAQTPAADSPDDPLISHLIQGVGVKADELGCDLRARQGALGKHLAKALLGDRAKLAGGAHVQASQAGFRTRP